MNHFSLLANFFVLSTQTPQTMQQPSKNNTSHPQQICLNAINEEHHDTTKKMAHKKEHEKKYKE